MSCYMSVFLAMFVVVATFVPAFWTRYCRRVVWVNTGRRRPIWLDTLLEPLAIVLQAKVEEERRLAERNPLAVVRPDLSNAAAAGKEKPRLSQYANESQPGFEDWKDGWRALELVCLFPFLAVVEFSDTAKQLARKVCIVLMDVACFGLASLCWLLTAGGIDLFHEDSCSGPIWELVALGVVAGAIAAGNWIVFGPNWVNVTITVITGCWLAYSFIYLADMILSARITPADF